ncbi:WXG100 family type VII secretion target [Microbacterium telephonicum]|uniref:WXG100 family type VII secretion target n=2 Tax=Microbacterium telephonicum TaxID=1714841 RepID=A0A498CJH0_9MICO|nr:WXG100 family type VII secretion target [Microbacterium telephonicum]
MGSGARVAYRRSNTELPGTTAGPNEGGPMANLNVTYDQMNSAAARLRDGQSELEANLQRLRQLVAQLVQDGFTTTRASGAFDASYTEFTTGATKTVQGIEGMASFLEKAAQALQSTDEQLASQLGQ